MRTLVESTLTKWPAKVAGQSQLVTPELNRLKTSDSLVNSLLRNSLGLVKYMLKMSDSLINLLLRMACNRLTCGSMTVIELFSLSPLITLVSTLGHF